MEDNRLDREQDNKEEIPYEYMVIKDFEKITGNTSQMKLVNI